MMRRITVVLLMMAATALSMPPASEATLIGHCGPVSSESTQRGFCHNGVSLSGSTLTITLENTSPLGGFIVADAFNLPAGVTASLISATNPHFHFFSASSVNVQPFGTRNQILTLAKNLNSPFQGAGGNPNHGISVSDGPETFVFSLTGLGATEAGILGSEAIRFKGFANGKSDKTLITLDEDPVATPEPTSLVLVGSGLTGFAHVIARRRRREPVRDRCQSTRG
jgi:hypothetical protein